MILRSLLRHYLRHPAQAVFLLAGVIIANVLLVGTQLINAQARASYETGVKVLGAGPEGEIVSSRSADRIDERLARTEAQVEARDEVEQQPAPDQSAKSENPELEDALERIRERIAAR